MPGAGRILLRDVYGWFARERRGVYRLTGAGTRALTASQLSAATATGTRDDEVSADPV